MSEELLWIRYRANRSIANRNRLVVFYLDLATRAGQHVNARMPVGLHETAELASYAAFGLIQSVERFSDERDAKFETFAWPRLIGSIRDELRSVNSQGRGDMISATLLMRAETTLLNSGTPINDTTLAGVLSMSVPEVRKLLVRLRSAERPVHFLLHDEDKLDHEADPSQIVARASELEYVRAAVGKLSERETEVIQLYDFQGLPLALIGARWDVGASRAHQIHTKALRHLQRLLWDYVSPGFGSES